MIDYGYGISLGHVISPFALEWRNCPEVFATCRQFTLLSDKSHQQWLDRIATDPSCKMFSIHSEEYHNIPVGVGGLTNICWQARHAEVSLYIAPSYQGKKLSFKALATICRHGFEDFNLNKLWGEIFNNNIKSIKIFTRLGFVPSPGHIQHYFREGKYIDTTFVSLLAQDWFSTQEMLRSKQDQSSEVPNGTRAETNGTNQ